MSHSFLAYTNDGSLGFRSLLPIAFAAAAVFNSIVDEITTSDVKQWSTTRLRVHIAMILYLAFWIGERIRQEIERLGRLLVVAWMIRIGESPFVRQFGYGATSVPCGLNKDGSGKGEGLWRNKGDC